MLPAFSRLNVSRASRRWLVHGMKGEVVYLYAFDVANEVVMADVGTVLSATPRPFEVRLGHTYPRDVPVYRPLAVEPAPAGVICGRTARLLVRIYDIGVVSVAVRVTFDAQELGGLMPYHRGRLDDGRALDAVARETCEAVCRDIAPAMVRAASPTEPEAYTVFCLTEIPELADVNAWLAAHRRELAGLLAETPADRLSDQQVGDTLRVQRSFEHTDLVVIDWDASLAIDLSGYVEDVLYVLELANLQLEEYRVMDRRLDEYFDRIYVELERARLPVLGGGGQALRSLRRFRVDAARLSDEVTHITKFLGDWYLARVYLGARDRFHLGQWRASVEQRLAQLDHLYSVVHAEVYDRRMLLLEMVIVVLFVIDLLGLFLWRR